MHRDSSFRQENDMDAGFPLGEFTCPIRFEMVRPPQPVVKHEEGVTYIVQGDYEIAFRTTLRFADGKELPTAPDCWARTVRRSLSAMPTERQPH